MHKTELKQLLQTIENRNSIVDIILLCETFLNSRTMKLVNMPNYTLVSNHQQNRKGGGTCVLIRKGITFKTRNDLNQFEDKVIETTFVEINSMDEKILLWVVYIDHPTVLPLNIISKLNQTTSKIKNEDKESILRMGHNLDLLKCNVHKQTQTLLDDLTDKDILPTITHPTRITQNTATLIDNIFVTEKLHHFFESAVLLSDISDHLSILTLLKQTKLLNRRPLEFQSCTLTENKI